MSDLYYTIYRGPMEDMVNTIVNCVQNNFGFIDLKTTFMWIIDLIYSNIPLISRLNSNQSSLQLIVVHHHSGSLARSHSNPVDISALSS